MSANQPSSILFESFIEAEARECDESSKSAIDGEESHSFRSDDATPPHEGTNLSESSFIHYRNRENRITLSDVEDEDGPDLSFVVPDDLASDSGDCESDSFTSANESAILNSSPLAPRVQPSRFAKKDLNTPSRRINSSPQHITDSLERVKEHVYKNKKEGSPILNPSESPLLATPGSRGRAILSSLESDEQRRILLEIYPELEDDDEPMDYKDVTPLRPCQKTFNAHLSALEESMEMCAVTPKTEVKSEPTTPQSTSGVSSDLHLPVLTSQNITPRRRPKKATALSSTPPIVVKKEENLDETGYRLDIVFGEPVATVEMDKENDDVVGPDGRNSRLSDGADDDSFEKYLKTLRNGPANKVVEECEHDEDDAHDSRSFVVDDDKVIFDDSTSCCSSGEKEEDEVDDESDFCPSDEDDDDSGCSHDDDDVIAPSREPNSRPGSSGMKTQSAKNKKSERKYKNDDDYFLDSLSPDYLLNGSTRHSQAAKFVSKGIKGKAARDDLTHTLFLMFKIRCFKSDVAMLDDCTVTWNPRLRKTAGMCRNRLHKPTGKKSASIELSTKVLTTPDRLRDTLVHEMCHAATWLIDGLAKAGHGPAWKRWAYQCLAYCPSLPHIERCHDYIIEAKYVYECPCGQLVKRHSKSLKTDRVVCARCRGKFVLRQPAGARGREGADKQTTTANKFALFVKENYGMHKKNGTTHKEVMTLLSAQWKASRSDSRLTTESPETEQEEKEDDVEETDVDVYALPEDGQLDMSTLSIQG